MRPADRPTNRPTDFNGTAGEPADFTANGAGQPSSRQLCRRYTVGRQVSPSG
jgi:hypothetical protein